MTSKLLLLITTLCLGQLTIAQTTISKFAYQKFSADTVIHIIDDIEKDLSVKHPGFYRYNSKEDFRKYIDSLKFTIKDSLTELESFQKIKSIISKIHCLHTGISLPQEYKDYLNQQPNLFPFKLYFIDNKAYVVKNYSDKNQVDAVNCFHDR